MFDEEDDEAPFTRVFTRVLIAQRGPEGRCLATPGEYLVPSPEGIAIIGLKSRKPCDQGEVASVPNGLVAAELARDAWRESGLEDEEAFEAYAWMVYDFLRSVDELPEGSLASFEARM